MHEGDLSEYLALGSAYQIYDPRSTVLTNGRYVRTPFTGNVIPKSRLDPVGVNLINLYPLPNQPGTRDFRNNFYRTGKALEDYWVWITRVDHAFSENHRVFLRLHRDYWEEDKNRNFNNSTNGVILNRNNKGLAFDDVYVFNASFLLNFRYGLTYQDFPERRASQGSDLAQPAFSSNLINQSQTRPSPPSRKPPWPPSPPSPSGSRRTASPPAQRTPLPGNFTKLSGNHSSASVRSSASDRESRNRYGPALVHSHLQRHLHQGQRHRGQPNPRRRSRLAPPRHPGRRHVHHR